MKSVCNRVWSNLAAKSVAVTIAGLLFGGTLASQSDREEEEIFELSPFTVDAGPDIGYRASSALAGTRISSKLGATAGGAQDIRFMRNLVEQGVIPSSSSFTPEGLFSEHDLPIGGEAPEGWLFDIAAQAIPFSSPGNPQMEVLAQLGFVSGINAATFKPAPLNLVAVVDKSGSMNGQPLDLVRKSLKQIVTQMGSDDQLSVVLYGSTTHVYLEPTLVTQTNRTQILNSIDEIQSYGSTAMESGLELGYATARESSKAFEGQTRLMLFTDEQPNVGRTDANSFMGMATAGSEEGIGLTTIGVSVHFGAELAEKISSVRGGNLFYFHDEEAMEEIFRKEFDTMVLELAYDMHLNIAPEPGIKIAGLYGIPGEAVTWEDDGSLSLEIATLFASRNKGAIFVGFGRQEGSKKKRLKTQSLATASISYTQADNQKNRHSELPISITPANERRDGILKGSYLVEQYAAMKQATILYESGQYAEATKVAQAFSERKLPFPDKGLRKENKLVTTLAIHLREDCEQRGISIAESKVHQGKQSQNLIGEWIETNSGLLDESVEILRFTEDQTAEVYDSSVENPLRFVDESEIEISRKYIVFNDWGRTFRYRIHKNSLELRDGNQITTYVKKRDLGHPKEMLDQHSINGLPSRRPDTLAAGYN